MWKVRKLWRSGWRRVQVRMGPRVVDRLTGHISETVLRWLGSCGSGMLHWDQT